MQKFITNGHVRANELSALQSLSLQAANQLIQWRDYADTTPGFKAFKIATAEVAFVGIALLGIIETVTRIALILIVAKPLDMTLGLSRTFHDYFMDFLATVPLTLFATSIAVAEIATNCLSEEREVNAGQSIYEVIDKAATSDALEVFRSLNALNILDLCI